MNNKLKQYDTYIDKFSYNYNNDGDVTPYIHLYPPLQLSDEKTLYKLPVKWLNAESEFLLAKEDRIRLVYSSTEGLTLRMLVRSNNKRYDLRKPICPVCGARLLETTTTGSIGRCVNLDCTAQTLNRTMLFLAALGLYMQGQNRAILISLLNNGKISDPADVFMLNVDDIANDNITEADAATFLHYLHSVRGKVEVTNFLRGLDIPNLSPDAIDRISKYCKRKNYGVLEIPLFFRKDIQERCPEVDWEPWNDYIQVAGNRDVIKRLCIILHI